jgi:hypothetical protein
MRQWIMVIMLCLTGSSLATVQRPQNAGQPTERQAQQVAPSTLPAPQGDKLGTHESPFIVKNYPQETSQSPTEAEEDRQERISTDRWTIRIGIASIFIGIFTIAILIVQAIVFWIQAARLKATVEEMQKATPATEKAANAAKESADTARDTLVVTNRPLMTLAIEPIQDLQADSNGIGFGIGVSTENKGNAPAIGVAIGVNLAGRRISDGNFLPTIENFYQNWIGHFEPDVVFQGETRTPQIKDSYPRPNDGDDDAEFVVWIRYGMLLDDRKFYTIFFFRPTDKNSGKELLDPDHRGRTNMQNITFIKRAFIS